MHILLMCWGDLHSSQYQSGASAVSVFLKDEALLCDLAKLVTSNLLKHPIDKEKVVRHSHSVIGSKILANAILIYIGKARHPENALPNLLIILARLMGNHHNRKLEILAGKISDRGMLFSFISLNICCIFLFLAKFLEVKLHEYKLVHG